MQQPTWDREHIESNDILELEEQEATLSSEIPWNRALDFDLNAAINQNVELGGDGRAHDQLNANINVGEVWENLNDRFDFTERSELQSALGGYGVQEVHCEMYFSRTETTLTDQVVQTLSSRQFKKILQETWRTQPFLQDPPRNVAVGGKFEPMPEDLPYFLIGYQPTLRKDLQVMIFSFRLRNSDILPDVQGQMMEVVELNFGSGQSKAVDSPKDRSL